MMLYIRSSNLVDFCLHVIFVHLERILSCPAVPQRHIEFLFRLYGKVLFERFWWKHQIDEDRMLLFLNFYSKIVDLHCVTAKVVERLQIIGPVITSLDISHTEVEEGVINFIVLCVPNMKHLNLRSTDCSDFTLRCLRECPNLLTLDLSSCEGITDEGLEEFCKNNYMLKSLNLKETDIVEQGLLAVLNEMPQIECLWHEDLAESLYAMQRDSKLLHSRYSLTEMIFERQTFRYESFEDKPAKMLLAWTILCPNIKKAVINFRVSEKTLEICSRFQYLEDLEINFQVDDSEDNERVARLFPVTIHFSFDYNHNVLTSILPLADKLTVLKLSNVKFSPKLLIEQFHRLKILGLRNVVFLDFNKSDIALKENRVETLVIEHMDLGFSNNWDCIHLLLSLSKNVTKLRLISISNLPEDMIDVIISSMKELSFVEFNMTDIDPYSAAKFAFIPSMTIMKFLEFWRGNYVIAGVSPFSDSYFLPGNTLKWNQYTNNDIDEDFFCTLDLYDYS